MKSMLITGGQGDLAIAIRDKYKNDFNILSPSSKDLDVTDKDAVTVYLRDLKVDLLINNAGTIHPENIIDSDMSLWERDIKVNLVGAYFVTKRVLEKNRSAIIINVASTAAFNAYPNWSSYCASKAGLVTFTKSLANDDYQSYALCPGAVNTKFRDNLGLDNSNAMTTDQFIDQLGHVLTGKYTKGDVIFFRKDEIKINPVF